jgi:predicted dehydrogenase
MAFSIKQNDTAPSLRATLKNGSGTVIDLTDATVMFHMKAVGDTSVKVDAATSIVDAENGIVQYNWTSSDTDTAGSYYAEFEVTYNDGTIETFPNNSNLSISIRAELN